MDEKDIFELDLQQSKYEFENKDTEEYKEKLAFMQRDLSEYYND